MYHILENTQLAERTVPPNYPNNVFESQTLVNINCGAGNPNNGGGDGNPLLPPPTIKGPLKSYILTMSSSLITYMDSLENSIPESEDYYYYSSMVQFHNQYLQSAKLSLIGLFTEDEEYSEMIQEFKNDEFLFKSFVYGSLVDKQKYYEARNFLNQLVASTEEQTDFVFVQNINLDRLEDYNHEVSQSDLNLLYNIGSKFYPMSGFARSLYRLLTGDKIDAYQHEEYREQVEINHLKSTESKNESFNIMPNPTSGILNISFKSDYENVELVIVDLTGRIMQIREFGSGFFNEAFDISHLNEGIYLAKIYNPQTNEYIMTRKLVKY